LNITAVTFYFDLNSEYYSAIVNDFNKYAEENKKDIHVDINIITGDTVGVSVINYAEMIEASLKKNKYDIYFYENNYLPVYAPYLLDLNEYVSKSIIDKYDPKLLSDLCQVEGRLIGLPIALFYTVFYSNEPLLKQYNKPIPKTWNEMLETGKFILNEERKKNNTELTGFNGLFSDDNQGTYSIFEFLYSYRDSRDEGFPDIKSQTFIDALNMMKKLKTELSSDEEFLSDEMYAISRLFDGKTIFVKYWILNDLLLNMINYNMTNLPGVKEGISSSVPAGFNIGLNKNISDEKLEGALTALEFLSSEEIQKKYLKKRELVSAINSLYYDEDVCKYADCDLFINMQPYSNPPFSFKDDPINTNKFRHYVHNFLYGNMTAEEVSKKIIDITKVYNISLDKTNSGIIGLVSTIIISVTVLLMFLSLTVLFKENFHPFFKFLSIDFWIFSVIGSISMLCLSFTHYGNITEKKCFLKSLIHSLGYSLTLVPVLYKLITKFPEENGISKWVKKYKYIFFLFFIALDIIWNSLLLITPYTVEEVIIDDGQNFQKCKAESTTCKLIMIVKWIYILIMLLALALLIFIEWNIRSIHSDLLLIVSIIYIDILGLLIIIVFNYIIT